MDMPQLTETLRLHTLWLKGGSAGVRADLSEADLRGADLSAVIGNMQEVRSMQIDTWPIAWTYDTLQIGGQRHPIVLWKKSDPRWIAAMAPKAAEWWGRFGPTILNLITIAPAVATGKEVAL